LVLVLSVIGASGGGVYIASIFFPNELLQVWLMSLTVTLMAGLFPAWKASYRTTQGVRSSASTPSAEGQNPFFIFIVKQFEKSDWEMLKKRFWPRDLFISKKVCIF
jgi:hypothetical protein